MTENLALWNDLSRTDPDHTKKFKRAGGFSGTSVKPIYCTRKMTERFGPCGKGWGMSAPDFQVVPAGDEIAVYCTVALWWEKPEQAVYGVGGDFVRKSQRDRMFADDEAFKKAFTDALGNAMKHLGMAADIHMGQHDDDKYVTALRREIAAENGTGSSAGSERRAPNAKAAGSSSAPSTNPTNSPAARASEWCETAKDRIAQLKSYEELLSWIQKNTVGMEKVAQANPEEHALLEEYINERCNTLPSLAAAG